ncbi:COMM domain-containing protein 4 [Ctenocephalides felis]|uniref:COMM domain-containing protein 4 n=1 Tax=Ctenocephalides felis TaxID=7515 RepID=UPI000E6E1E38|nr:COMM domain-containing protein 4 [Ctenocephalides felis]
MRFRFCGGADCPDWLLAELHALSRLSSVRVRQLATLVVQSILDGKVDEEKLIKIMSDTKLDILSIKAASSCVNFVLQSAARHGAVDSALSSELQQLGLPREHSAAICKVYNEQCAAITAKLREQSLRVNRLKEVTANIPENTIDCVQLNLTLGDVVEDGQRVTKEHIFNIGKEDLIIMINELKKARSLMQELSKSS